MSLVEKDQIQRKIQKQFDSLADHYDEAGFWNWYFIKSADVALGLSKRFFQPLQKINVLDVGCGTGTLITKLGTSFPSATLVGLDISQKMLNIAERKTPEVGRANTKFILADIESVELDNQFDLIFCLNSFHHYQDPSGVLFKMNRLTKKGGLVMLLDPISDGPARKFWNMLLKNVLFDEPYAQYFSKAQLTKMADHAGFHLLATQHLLYFIWISLWRNE